jgi:hypothetical protein
MGVECQLERVFVLSRAQLWTLYHPTKQYQWKTVRRSRIDEMLMSCKMNQEGDLEALGEGNMVNSTQTIEE